MGLTDAERAYAVEQAAIVLQPTATRYKMELAEGKSLRPLVVAAAVLRALIYIKNETRALSEGRDCFDDAGAAADEADAMLAAKGLTPDEEEFVIELSYEASSHIERACFLREPQQQPIQWVAVAATLAAAFAHVDDWEKYGWLKHE